MKNFNYSGIALAVVSALLSGASLAAESSDVGEINVKGQSLGGGLMVQEDSGKARSTLTKEAMESCKIHMKQECMSDLDEEI